MSFFYEMRDAMFARGFPFSGNIRESLGQYHAFTSENGDCKNNCCRYRLFECDLGAHLTCWRRSLDIYWFVKEFKTFSEVEKSQFAQERERKRQLQIEQQQEATLQARENWANATAISSSHPYVIRKQIQPIYAKQLGVNILLPVYNSKGQIISTQEIYPDGFKKFATGAPVGGGMLFLGEHVTPIIRISEGWATGCSIYEAVGETVIVAFSGNNLEKVAKIVQHVCPTSKIHVCGDNEPHGIRYAQAAARATCSKSIYPDFSKFSGMGKDFNDLANIAGIEEVRNQILN